jgi:hypothetical protein
MMVRVTETAGAALVWLRALALGSVALVAGSVAHVGAHGALPAPLVLVALLALGTAGVAPLLRRQASTARVVLLLVVGQAAVHAALTALGGHHDDEPLAHPGHGPALWVAHLAEDLTPEHALMAGAHAVAAAVVGLWLAHGERTVWRLVALAGRVLAEVNVPLLPVAGRPRVVPVPPALLPRVVRVAPSSIARRGPPGSCARDRIRSRRKKPACDVPPRSSAPSCSPCCP